MRKYYLLGGVLLVGILCRAEALAAPTLTVNGSTGPIAVSLGSSVTMGVQNGPGTVNDCVTLDLASVVNNHAHLGFAWVNGSTATLAFVMPSTPGVYALRFWQNCATQLAISSTITVQSSSIPVLIVNGGTSPITVAAAATVTVGVQNGITNDCLTLDRASVVDNNAHLGFAWVSGNTATFTMPNTAGAYAIRYWRSCATQLAISPTVTVPAIQFRTLTVLAGGSGSGTVTGSGQYAVGTTIPITATPAAGSVFVGWSDTSGAFGCASGTIVMPNDSITCTAIFMVLRNLVILKDGNGTGTVTGAGQYLEGTIVTIGATADEGSTFSGWKDTSGPWGCVSGRFQMPANSITCTATFTLTQTGASGHHLTGNRVAYVYGIQSNLFVPPPAVAPGTGETILGYVSVSVGDVRYSIGWIQAGIYGANSFLFIADSREGDTHRRVTRSDGSLVQTPSGSWVNVLLVCCDAQGRWLAQYSPGLGTTDWNFADKRVLPFREAQFGFQGVDVISNRPLNLTSAVQFNSILCFAGAGLNQCGGPGGGWRIWDETVREGQTAYIETLPYRQNCTVKYYSCIIAKF